MNRIAARAASLAQQFWLAPEVPDFAAFLRLALSILGLLQLTVLWPHLLALYGNFGFIQWAVVEASNNAWAPSIGKVAVLVAEWGISSETVVYALFGIYGVSLVGLLIGYRTRWFAILAWITHSITLNSGFFSLYGVDTMMHILFFYLMFSPAGAKWSLDSYLHRTSSAPSSVARIAQRLLQLHLCIIYLNTGLAKASGQQWWNGEAIWRAVMQPQYNVFDFSWLAAHPLLPTMIGWSVVLLELGYAVLIWIPATRRSTLLATILMHVGIALTLRLWLFSLVMIGFNLAAFGWSQRGLRTGSSPVDAAVPLPFTDAAGASR